MEDPTLKDVLKEMSQAPGGRLSNLPRPLIPIKGGPPEEYKPGKVDPVTGTRTVRDPAVELFKFYATGQVRESAPIKPPKPNTKAITVIPGLVSEQDQRELQARKDAGLIVKQTKERARTRAGIRGGVVGGMSRPIGSKPPLTGELSVAINTQIKRARRDAERALVRDALEKIYVASFYEGISEEEFLKKTQSHMLSREEAKYLDDLTRRINDLRLDYEETIKNELASRGQSIPTFEQFKEMREADRRTLEGRKIAERNRISRGKTEIALQNLPERINRITGGTGMATFDFISLLLNGYLLYKQDLARLSTQKREIS